MIEYLYHVTICWALFYLLYICLLRRETFFEINRWYLLGTLFLGLLIPVLEFQLPFSTSAIPTLKPANYLETITITAQALEANLETIVITPVRESWSAQLILLSIYWAGVLFFTGRFLLGLSQIIRLRLSGVAVRKTGYTLIKTNKVHLPFSFMGYLFWSDKVEFDGEDEDRVLRHELCHIRDGHSLDVLFTEAVSIFLWCSPFVFFYKRELKNIHEYLADSAVLRNTPTRTYGQLLLRQSQSGLQIAQANNFIHSQLKKRILMMTKTKSQRSALLKYAAVLPILLLLVLSISARNNLVELNNYPSGLNELLDTIPPTADLAGGANEVFQVVEDMPRFPGCEDQPEAERQACAQQKMLMHIYSNLNYPKEARKAGVQGKAITQFIIEKDGSISNVEMKRSLSPEIDVEVKRVISSMPKFIPGKQRGKNVRVQFVIPVKFKLDDDKAAIKHEKIESTDKNWSTDEVFKVVEKMPIFPGATEVKAGNQKMFAFIFENLKYPKTAKEAGVQGTVVVNFIISEDGRLTKPKIVRSLGSGTDEEVMRVIELMSEISENWTPGYQRGKAVKVSLNLPLKFKLDEEAKNSKKPEAVNDKPATSKDVPFESVRVYPNPTANSINVELSVKNDLPTTLIITDSNGKKIYQQKFDTNQIQLANYDLKDAANGIVLLSFLQEGKILLTKEVTLQH